MSLEQLIEELSALIAEGTSLPLAGGKCIIDRERAKELIAEIQASAPEELRQARSIVADRNEILAKANREAEELMKRAEAHAKKLISQEEIVRMAASRANEIVTLTQNRANEVKRNTSDYANLVLGTLEETLAKTLIEVRNSRQQLKAAPPQGKAEQ